MTAIKLLCMKSSVLHFAHLWMDWADFVRLIFLYVNINLFKNTFLGNSINGMKVKCMPNFYPSVIRGLCWFHSLFWLCINCKCSWKRSKFSCKKDKKCFVSAFDKSVAPSLIQKLDSDTSSSEIWMFYVGRYKKLNQRINWRTKDSEIIIYSAGWHKWSWVKFRSIVHLLFIQIIVKSSLKFVVD